MKTTIACAGIVLILVLSIGCEKESRGPVASNTLELAKTYPGGCNTMDFKQVGENQDTLIFSVENDSLNIFTGVNYICCAPFSASLKIENDSVLITIKDICPDAGSCYCHCMCYYTWDFKLVEFVDRTFSYKAILDGRDGTQLIQKGSFTVEGPDITVE
jgi:hypothetical protein